MSRSNALLYARRRDERALLNGRVRECKQWAVFDDWYVYHWDFAYRDPASGRDVQYTTEARAKPDMNPIDFAERVRAPALACLAMMIQRKCGIREAIANQIQLELPRTAVGRFV